MTLTAQLFAEGSDTSTQTASTVTEATNRLGRYVATFTDAPAGDYLLVYFEGTIARGTEPYTLTLETATSIPNTEKVGSASGGDATLAKQNEIISKFNAASVQIVSKYSTSTGTLTLQQGVDYTVNSVNKTIDIPIPTERSIHRR